MMAVMMVQRKRKEKKEDQPPKEIGRAKAKKKNSFDF